MKISDCEIMFSLKLVYQHLRTTINLIGQYIEEHHAEYDATVGDPGSSI